MALINEGTELSLLSNNLQSCGQGYVRPNWGKWVEAASPRGVKGKQSPVHEESDFISGESHSVVAVAFDGRWKGPECSKGRKPEK